MRSAAIAYVAATCAVWAQVAILPFGIINTPTRQHRAGGRYITMPIARMPEYNSRPMEIHRKTIRLPAENYFGQRYFFITFCCHERHCVFYNHEHASWLVQKLRMHTQKSGFLLHAFCVMPDHVHLLVQGTTAGSSLVTFLRSFKQSTAQEYLAKSRDRLWQKRFYDYILRPRDSADDIAWYIWLNPVRKGICARPEEYPFSGSLTLPWPRSSASDLKWSPPWKKLPIRPSSM